MVRCDLCEKGREDGGGCWAEARGCGMGKAWKQAREQNFHWHDSFRELVVCEGGAAGEGAASCILVPRPCPCIPHIHKKEQTQEKHRRIEMKTCFGAKHE